MTPSLLSHKASSGMVQRAATVRSDSVGLLAPCRPMRPAFAPANPIPSFSAPAAQSSSVTCMASKGFGPAKPQAKPKQTTPPTPCTCGSGKAYKRCCEPLHQGTSAAESPEQTLRARFSAYGKGVAPYLLSTTHPDYHTYRFNVPAGTAGEKMEEEIKASIEKFEYAGLKVTKNEPGSSEDEGFVTFEYVSRKKPSEGQPAPENWSKTGEKCRFVRVDGKWLFVDYQTYTYDGSVAAAAAAVDKVADVEPLAGAAGSA